MALYESRWKLSKTLSMDRVLDREPLYTIKFASDSPKYSYVEFTLIYINGRNSQKLIFIFHFETRVSVISQTKTIRTLILSNFYKY